MATPTKLDSYDDLWEFAEYCAKEARLLRSFLEYLATWDDPIEYKLERLKNWRGEVGLHLGAPEVIDEAQGIFQTFRELPPEQRREALRASLNEAHAKYFGD